MFDETSAREQGFLGINVDQNLPTGYVHTDLLNRTKAGDGMSANKLVGQARHSEDPDVRIMAQRAVTTVAPEGFVSKQASNRHFEVLTHDNRFGFGDWVPSDFIEGHYGTIDEDGTVHATIRYSKGVKEYGSPTEGNFIVLHFHRGNAKLVEHESSNTNGKKEYPDKDDILVTRVVDGNTWVRLYLDGVQVAELNFSKCKLQPAPES